MMKTILALAVTAALLLCPQPSLAQPGKAERYTVPLTDPSRPVRLRVSLLMGSISVEAYNGKEVVIESLAREARRDAAPGKEGMHRVPMAGADMNIEERNNVVTVETESLKSSVDLRIQVPVQTSVRLETFQNGEIRITGVRGDHELSNTNGGIEARQVSGSVVAHTVNGRVLVTFANVAPDKAMGFSTLNGAIDVTLPASTRANLRIESMNGDVFTDFDVATRQPVSKERPGGGHRINVERGVFGSINGGGPELQFKTLNGNIHLRRSGS
jgi:DUF4097 and DUF4098 domain-containing protein YvlB